MGSGITATVTETTLSTSLIYNGSFRLATVANVPDGWTVIAGTPGTNVKLTGDAQQTVTIPSGTIVAGSFVLQWSDGTRTYRRANLPCNVTAATIQPRWNVPRPVRSHGQPRRPMATATRSRR